MYYFQYVTVTWSNYSSVENRKYVSSCNIITMETLPRNNSLCVSLMHTDLTTNFHLFVMEISTSLKNYSIQTWGLFNIELQKWFFFANCCPLKLWVTQWKFTYYNQDPKNCEIILTHWTGLWTLVSQTQAPGFCSRKLLLKLRVIWKAVCHMQWDSVQRKWKQGAKPLHSSVCIPVPS